jgi:c(7)-type cytochrome triheme protein
MSYDHDEAAAVPSSVEIKRKVDVTKQELQNLPDDLMLGLGDASPGGVAFSHQNHISFQDGPSCASCHPKPYSFGVDDKKRQRGEAMHSADSCGSCHNGDKAFAVDGDCSTCHRE